MPISPKGGRCPFHLGQLRTFTYYVQSRHTHEIRDQSDCAFD